MEVDFQINSCGWDSPIFPTDIFSNYLRKDESNSVEDDLDSDDCEKICG